MGKLSCRLTGNIHKSYQLALGDVELDLILFKIFIAFNTLVLTATINILLCK